MFRRVLFRSGQIMGVLFVKPKIPTPDGEDAQPLLCFNEESITEQRQVMPIFDEWGIVPKGHRGPRPNPWAVEPETMGEGPEPEETEESEGSSQSEAPSGEDDASRGTVPGGEDEASRGTGPGGEDEARSGANPSRGSATTSRSAPVEVDLHVLSSSDEEDNFHVARSRRAEEGKETGGGREGRSEPRSKAVHDRRAPAARTDPRGEARTPQEAGASSAHPPMTKKRVWVIAGE